MDQILESQQTPHISPSWASLGVSIVRILEKTDCIIIALHNGYQNWTPSHFVAYFLCLQTPQNNTEIASQQLPMFTQPTAIWWDGYHKAAFNKHIRGGHVLIITLLLLMHHLFMTDDQLQGSNTSLHMRSIFKAYSLHTIFLIKKYAMLYSCIKVISQNLITATNRIISTH